MGLPALHRRLPLRRLARSRLSCPACCCLACRSHAALPRAWLQHAQLCSSQASARLHVAWACESSPGCSTIHKTRVCCGHDAAADVRLPARDA